MFIYFRTWPASSERMRLVTQPSTLQPARRLRGLQSSPMMLGCSLLVRSCRRLAHTLHHAVAVVDHRGHLLHMIGAHLPHHPHHSSMVAHHALALGAWDGGSVFWANTIVGATSPPAMA